jgi:hypothetical protein
MELPALTQVNWRFLVSLERTDWLYQKPLLKWAEGRIEIIARFWLRAVGPAD